MPARHMTGSAEAEDYCISPNSNTHSRSSQGVSTRYGGQIRERAERYARLPGAPLRRKSA
jgi:hypothetical protein